MKMYAMRDRKSGRFIAEDYINDENSIHDHVFLVHKNSLEEIYEAGKIFFYKPMQQAEYMSKTYKLDVEIVTFTRKVEYKEIDRSGN